MTINNNITNNPKTTYRNKIFYVVVLTNFVFTFISSNILSCLLFAANSNSKKNSIPQSHFDSKDPNKITKIKISSDLFLEKSTLDKVILSPEYTKENKNFLPAKVSISYVMFSSKSEKNTNLSQELNEELVKIYKSIFYDSEDLDYYVKVKEKNIDSFIKSFVEKFEKDFKNACINDEFQNDVGGWFINIDSSIVYLSSDFISFEIKSSVFIGGAHPISQIRLFTIDLSERRLITLENIINNNNLDSFLKLAESIFRKTQNILPNQSFQDVGYYFENNKFAINNNFYIDKKGITFIYNPYEIAPYSFGPIKLFVPWSSIRNLIDKRSRVSKLL